MTTPQPPRPSGWPKRLAVAGLLLGPAGLAGWLIAVQAAARSDLTRGTAALEAGDPAAARTLLDRCLTAWPQSAEAHFRAAQAARRCGDLEAAGRHLDEADRLRWDGPAVELERALIQAQAGDLRSVEAGLLGLVADGHPQAPEILAALIPAYMDEFRWREAEELAEKWIALRPDAARPWALAGEILERGRRMKEAVRALREAARLDPTDQKTRLRLARILLERRYPPDEAARHLEWLSQVSPDDPAVRVQLAVCREAQGRPEEAVTLLDEVLASHPEARKAAYHRGRLALDRGDPTAAAPFLRQAARQEPWELDVLNALVTCLHQIGAADEARAVEARREQCQWDLRRVSQLAREVSASPRNPDLRREMGELFLRYGIDKEGVRWLESALREQPDHVPTHKLLAEYYARRGDREKAASHDVFVSPSGR